MRRNLAAALSLSFVAILSHAQVAPTSQNLQHLAVAPPPSSSPSQFPPGSATPENNAMLLDLVSNPDPPSDRFGGTPVKSSSDPLAGRSKSIGQAPPPTAEDRRGMYTQSPGIVSIMDDASSSRVYPLTCLIYHSTLIQLPTNALKVYCGDLQAWALDVDGQYVTIKPLATNVGTNLHCITTDGHAFNFRLSSIPNGDYTDFLSVVPNKPFQANQEHLLEQRVATIKAQLEKDYQEKLAEGQDTTAFKTARKYAKTTYNDYKIKQAASFSVSAVFNDAAFTYFTVSGDEKPTVYLETKAGWFHKPVRELLNFNVTSGDFYRVQKILEPGQRLILLVRTDEATISRKGK